MKKKRFLSGFCFCLAALSLFGACSKTPKMTYEKGKYLLEGSEKTYVCAPIHYEAASYYDAVVATFEDSVLGTLNLYPTDGSGENLFLTASDGRLFVSSDVALPSFGELQLDRVMIGASESVFVSFGELNDADTLADLQKAVVSGDSFSVTEIDPAISYERYDVKFHSENYPILLYSLALRRYESEVLVYRDLNCEYAFGDTVSPVTQTTEEYGGETYIVYRLGTDFLYDSETKLCYPVGGIFSEIIGE